MYGYGQQYNLERINNQIRELEAIRNNYQNPPQMQQQPVTNIINTGNSQNFDFEARILNENEKVDEILVQRKTAFINLINGQLSIKELNGDVKSYKIELPKTKEQIENEELKAKLKEMEQKINELSNANEYGKSNEKNVKPAKINDTGATKDI